MFSFIKPKVKKLKNKLSRSNQIRQKGNNNIARIDSYDMQIPFKLTEMDSVYYGNDDCLDAKFHDHHSHHHDHHHHSSYHSESHHVDSGYSHHSSYSDHSHSYGSESSFDSSSSYGGSDW